MTATPTQPREQRARRRDSGRHRVGADGAMPVEGQVRGRAAGGTTTGKTLVGSVAERAVEVPVGAEPPARARWGGAGVPMGGAMRGSRARGRAADGALGVLAGAVARTLLAGPVLLPVAVAPALLVAAAAAFPGGGNRRWFGRGEGQRAEAQAAKDAAASAFYELDTAQRDLRISVETITATDGSPAGRKTAADFEAFGRRVDEVSQSYIAAVDAHDLDRDDLDAGAAARARADLTRAKDELEQVRRELERFGQSLGPQLSRAESQLARVAPAVERARQALRAASEALDTARGHGLKADELASRLAALAPELTLLNEGAARHGVQETIRRADATVREAEAVRSEAERLPERATEIDKRIVSLRTRADALSTRAGSVSPVLSELRRRYSTACWQDLQHVPDEAARSVERAGAELREAQTARTEQRWADASSLLASVRALLDTTDEAVSAAGDRLRRLDAVSFDRQQEVDRTRFAIRDAQRLAMSNRATPDPRHARPLDEAVARLERAEAGLEGRHPDWWRFLTETEAIRETAARVVREIREERGTG